MNCDWRKSIDILFNYSHDSVILVTLPKYEWKTTHHGGSVVACWTNRIAWIGLSLSRPIGTSGLECHTGPTWMRPYCPSKHVQNEVRKGLKDVWKIWMRKGKWACACERESYLLWRNGRAEMMSPDRGGLSSNKMKRNTIYLLGALTFLSWLLVTYHLFLQKPNSQNSKLAAEQAERNRWEC